MKRLTTLLTAIMAALLLTSLARADIVHLKNGNTLEGKVQVNGDKITITKKEGLSVTIDLKDVDHIEKQKSKWEIYQEKLENVNPRSADEHYRLGLWCKENELRAEAEKAFRKAIEINPDHEAAHLVLGHTKVEGRWLTEDEQKMREGYEKYNGRWVTPDAAERLRDAEKSRKWRSRLFKYVRKIVDGDESEKATATGAILDIRDENAENGLIDLMDHKNSEVRMLAMRALGNLSGDRSAERLIKSAVKDYSSSVRKAAAEALKARNHEEAHKTFLSMFIHNSDSDIRVNALGAVVNMKDKRAVPVLIELLMFETVSKGAGRAPKLGFVGGVEYKIFNYRIYRYGNNAALIFRIPVLISIDPFQDDGPHYVFNPLVREALIKITGENFNFEKDKWHKWWEENRDSFDAWMNEVEEKASDDSNDKKSED